MTSPFRLDVHGAGRCEFSHMLAGHGDPMPGPESAEILAFFVSDTDPDDAVLAGELDVPYGSAVSLLARRVAASPAATEAMASVLRGSIAACPCKPGTTECPALDPPSLLHALEAATHPATPPGPGAFLPAPPDGKGHHDHPRLLRRLLLYREPQVTAPDNPAPATAATGQAVTVPESAAVTGADEGESRAADLMLARVADARVLMASSVPARVMVLATVVVQTVTGAWLRGHLPPSGQLVAVACLVAVAWGVLLPWLSRWQGDPRWIAAARTHEQLLGDRVPAPCLETAIRHAAAAGRRADREAFLYVPRCTRPGRPHLGACHLAGVLPLTGRLLVVLGEHLASGPAGIVAGVLGHEVLHLTSWRLPLTYLRTVLSFAGPVLLGWTVPWPFLPAAVAGFVIAMTAASWLTEISCDLGSARAGGAAGVLGGLDYLSGVIAAGRAAIPAWLRYVRSALTWVSGPVHPPLPLRRALITTLTRAPSGGWASGWMA